MKCTSSGSLKNHVTRLHFQEFLHYCKYCEYGNNTKDLVYSHLVAKHGAEREFECGEHNLIPGCGENVLLNYILESTNFPVV